MKAKAKKKARAAGKQICSNCHDAGHNKRTCTFKKKK